MSLFHFIEIKFADPVSSMIISDKYAIIGTMMGRLTLSTLYDKKNNILSEFSTENITGIQFETEETFNVSVGDDEILRYKLHILDNKITAENFHQKNYEDELVHKSKCEGCYTILSKSHLIMMHLPNTDNGNPVEIFNNFITVN